MEASSRMLKYRDEKHQSFSQSATARGERLYPSPSSRLYWVLTSLRQEFETITSLFLPEVGERPGRLIDFGCGNMPYRPLFASRVGKYIGCDLPGNELTDITLERPDRLPFEAGFADVLFSSQVLEHVVDPDAYLAECHRVLSVKGLLILSTHGVWRYHPDPLDLWRWTSAGLRRVVERAGFSVIHFRGVLGPAATALQLWQDAVLPKCPWRFRGLFVRALQRWIQSADLACNSEERDRDASVYVVVGRKE